MRKKTLKQQTKHSITIPNKFFYIKLKMIRIDKEFLNQFTFLHFSIYFCTIDDVGMYFFFEWKKFMQIVCHAYERAPLQDVIRRNILCVRYIQR